MSDVKIYLTERLIDGSPHAESVCARSWEEAEALAGTSGTRLLGELQYQVCAQCGSQTDIASILPTLTVNKKPPLGDDEWPDEVE